MVPPVVGDHEGVQPRPGVAHAGHEVDAFRNAALGQHDMGQGVVAQGSLRHRWMWRAAASASLSRWHCSQPKASMPCRGHIEWRVAALAGPAAEHGGRVAAGSSGIAELERGQVARVHQGLFLVAGRWRGAMSPFTQARHSSHNALFAGVARSGGQWALLMNGRAWWAPRDSANMCSAKPHNRPGTSGLASACACSIHGPGFCRR